MASELRGTSRVVREYLWTIADLEANAVKELGSMNDGTYEEFVEKMKKIATEAGIINPVMGVGIKFKEGAHPFVKEIPSPITTKDDWSVFKKDAETMCEYMPKVFVIDGSKFALPL